MAGHCRIEAALESRHGFSIIELLVSLGVIGLLVALTLPAIQSGRESARKTQCANNLRQIGEAYHAFEASYGRFPPIDFFNDAAQIASGQFPRSGARPVSAQFLLLPYLDQSSLYNQFNFQGDVWGGADPLVTSKNQSLIQRAILPLFACPSDNHFKPGDTSYLISDGTSPGGGYTTARLPDSESNVANLGVGSGASVLASRITDGLSQTVAFSERLVGDKDPSRYVPARDWAYVGSSGTVPVSPDEFVNLCAQNVLPRQTHASYGNSPWLIGRLGTTAFNHLLIPNSRVPDCSLDGPYGAGPYTARSLHHGGVLVLLADGAVRFVSEVIELDVWRALGTMDGNEPILDF